MSSLGMVSRYSAEVTTNLIDPYFTDHSKEHVERILLLVEQILKLNQEPDLLSDAERYVLKCATHLHDIGMQAEGIEDNSEKRRDRHHELTREIIERNHATIGLLQPYAVAVAQVAVAHRGDELARVPEVANIGTGRKLKLRLLACLLFLGDELDITYERVGKERFDLLNMPAVSAYHFYKHYYTGGIAIMDDGCIKVTFRYPKDRADQYHAVFGRTVTSKVREVCSATAQVLSHSAALALACNNEDIAIEEDATLDSVDPALYAEIIKEIGGAKNFRTIKSLASDEQRGKSSPELFYQGNVDWPDIIDNLDIARSQASEIWGSFRELHEYSYTERSLTGLVLTGEGGSGKTTSLMRLAYKISCNDDYSDLNLLWLPADSPFRLDQLQQLYYSNQKPIVVFIDGVGIDAIVERIVSVIERVDDLRLPLMLVFAVRRNEWDNARGNTIPFGKHELLQLEKLTDEEIWDLIDQLEKYGQLYTLADLTRDERYSRLKERSEGQLLVAMLEATRGKRFLDIVIDEYQNLCSAYPEAAKAYRYLSLFFMYDVLIPQELLISLVDCADNEEFEDLVLGHTKLVIVQHPFVRFGIRYRPRHRTIAEVLISHLSGYNDLKSRLKRATVVLRHIQPLDRQQRYVILDFLRNVILREAKYGVKHQYVDNINEIGGFVEKHKELLASLIEYATQGKFLAELVLWSNLFDILWLPESRIFVLGKIIQIKPNDREANYRLARLLSRTHVLRENPGRIADLYKNSYFGGNRRMRFLHEYLVLCLKNDLNQHLDLLIKGFANFVAHSPDEEELRTKVDALIKGYMIDKDRDKLTTDMVELDEHLRASSSLSPAEELAYIDLLESKNPRRRLQQYETYLLALAPNRPRSILLRIARLASKTRGNERKSYAYYQEIYENYIRKNPRSDDYDIVLEYATIAARHGLAPKGNCYGLFRRCIQLRPSDLRSYVEYARFCISKKDDHIARDVLKAGKDVTRSLQKWRTREGRAITDLLARLDPH